ncbi:MAG: type II toxin-antitoxin system RelB/DinJ family antitoxin [Neisseriaceae bacterium]|nr:type II toxin-antitoxin system RelB/DinJ family antitoxin [Neisseriaceae bacterium]
MSVNYSVRLDENLKNQAFSVIEEYGLTPAQVIKMFFRQIAETRAIPVSLRYKSDEPNEETQRAMREADEDFAAGRLKVYNSNQEMYEDLKKEFANE